MSYLDSPRLHFSGWFQADVSTINNDVRFFQNASFVPEYQQLDQNGSWNPEGTGIFRLLDCWVTGAFLNGKQLTSPTDDPVIGMTVQNAAGRAPGKLVDLDPQQQMVSQIWGMQVRLVNSAAQTPLQGEYKPAAFTNLWKRQQQGVRRDQQLAACYQSVLEEVSWPDASGSSLLEALQGATEDDMLSIEFNVYGYGRDSTIPRYTMGHIAGTIRRTSRNQHQGLRSQLSGPIADGHRRLDCRHRSILDSFGQRRFQGYRTTRERSPCRSPLAFAGNGCASVRHHR